MMDIGVVVVHNIVKGGHIQEHQVVLVWLRGLSQIIFQEIQYIFIVQIIMEWEVVLVVLQYHNLTINLNNYDI